MIDHSPPLTGRRILLTRSAAGGTDLGLLLRTAGAEVTGVDVLRSVIAPDPARLDLALLSLAAGGYDWLGLTSAAAVRAVEVRAAELAVTPPLVPAHTRIAVVGPATESAALDAHWPVHLRPPRSAGAAALADCWPAADGDHRTVLLPVSDLALPDLADRLAAKGYAVDRVVAYRTELVPAPDSVLTALATGGFDAVLVTSPSAAIALFGATHPGGRTALISIGATTAAALAALGMPNTTVASEPTAAAVLDAALAALDRWSGPIRGPLERSDP